MNYSIFKLHFLTALHIGDKSLTDSLHTICADTIFSALCYEALKLKGSDGIEELSNSVRSGKLLISDGLPYIGETLYLPKPNVDPCNIIRDNKFQVNKIFKKMKFLSLSDFNDFLTGSLDENNALKVFSGLGKSAMRVGVNVRIRDINGDPEPYHFGVYNFAENSGLYVIVGYEGSVSFIEELFQALSYTGIGGKRSAGLGKFDFYKEDIGALQPLIETNDKKRFMTINVSMAKDVELENALDGASYQLQKRSGFISSFSRLDVSYKKRDFFCFAAGSCFVNRFDGDLFDLSRPGTGHPVYRYAKPFFVGVDV
jgi:CRISPR-associated protein Csm4